MELKTMCFMSIIIGFTQSQTLQDVKSLHQNLFSGYKKEVMPMEDHSKPLNVGIQINIGSINSFKEIEECLYLTAAVLVNWTDPSLKWNALSYGNLTFTVIDSKDLWLPSVFLKNSAKAMEPLGGDTKFKVTIQSSGQVLYATSSTLMVRCPTDISKFPFDTQTCTLTFIFWDIPSSKITMKSIYDEAQLNMFNANSDWTLQEYKTEDSGKNDASFNVRLKLKRQSLYYTVMVILPTLLLAFLNPLVFILPADSGERISFAMTILLSYAIFLTLVSTSIPSSSNPMCFLLIIMITIISISGIIVFGSIVTVHYYFIEDKSTIGYKMKLLVKLMSRFRNFSVGPESEKAVAVISGKDVAKTLDCLLLYGTYITIVLAIICYFMYVLA